MFRGPNSCQQACLGEVALSYFRKLRLYQLLLHLWPNFFFAGVRSLENIYAGHQHFLSWNASNKLSVSEFLHETVFVRLKYFYIVENLSHKKWKQISCHKFESCHIRCLEFHTWFDFSFCLLGSFIVFENQFFRVLHNLDAIRGRRLELPLTLEGEGFEARSAEVEAQPRRWCRTTPSRILRQLFRPGKKQMGTCSDLNLELKGFWGDEQTSRSSS